MWESDAVNDARLELRLPSGLLERMDEQRGDLSRAAFVRAAVEKALAPSPSNEQPRKRHDHAIENAGSVFRGSPSPSLQRHKGGS